MKTLLSFAFLALLAIGGLLTIGGQAMAEKAQLKILDTIHGSNFLAIRAAIAALKRPNFDVQRYKIVVLQDQESVVVLFNRMDQREDIPANLGVLQGADAELNSAALRSYLSRMEQLKALDKIQGKSFLAIETAVGVFKERKPDLDLADYKITLVREADSVFVSFTDKDAKPGARGAGGALPGFQVELSAIELQVLGSNYIR